MIEPVADSTGEPRGMPARPTVLITGATGGIGFATVCRYAREGYRVILADIDGDALARRVVSLRGEYPDADFDSVVLDQSSFESVRAAADTVRQTVATLSAVAVVGGVVQSIGARVTELPVDEWDRVHGVNLRGVFLVAQQLLPLVTRDGSGAFVSVASLWGEEAHPFYAAYCTAKAGLISLTQVMAREFADERIRVNAVAPGNIDTEMHRAAIRDEAATRGITFEEMRDSEWSKIPMKVAGPASAIADALYFLTSADAGYITGTTLDVNGGVFMK